MALAGRGVGVPSCSLGRPRTAGPVAFRPQCSRVPHPGAHTSPELRHPHPALPQPLDPAGPVALQVACAGRHTSATDPLRKRLILSLILLR